MGRELPGYRDNLQDILEFFGGRRLLTVADVKAYTGLHKHASVKRRFPFQDNRISAATLARCLAGGDRA